MLYQPIELLLFVGGVVSITQVVNDKARSVHQSGINFLNISRAGILEVNATSEEVHMTSEINELNWHQVAHLALCDERGHHCLTNASRPKQHHPLIQARGFFTHCPDKFNQLFI